MGREIFNENFSTQNEAIKKMASYDYGVKKSSKFNLRKFTINSNKEKEEEKLNNVDFDLCFESEDNDGFYFYRIENHNSYFKLVITQTVKHKMITGAIEGDLEIMIDNFVNTDKMIRFALEKAIENGNWNIVEYIIDEYDIKENPLCSVIKYDKAELLWKLFDKGYKLPNDWLTYCMYNDSITVTRKLLNGEKVHFKSPISEIKTNWFNREVQKDKETSNFVRKFLKIPKSLSSDEILKRIKF